MKAISKRPLQMCLNQISKLAVVLILFSSCGTIYYAPNQPNLPMIKEKGITQVAAGIAAGEYSSTIDVSAAHSITNHAGLTASFSSYYLDGNALNTIDVGAGYFLPLGEKAGFEVYPSLGYGKLKVIDDWSGEFNWESKMFRASVFPDVFYESEHFGAAFGLRLLYFKYESPLFSLYSSQSNVMLEPTACITAGWQHFKFKLQGTFSSKVNSGYLDYDNAMLSFGISVKLGQKKTDEVKTNNHQHPSSW